MRGWLRDMMVGVELLDSPDGDEQLIGILMLRRALEKRRDDQILLLLAARNRPRPSTDMFYLRMNSSTPLTARQMWWQLHDKEAWWDKLFRFKVDEFFDDLLPVLALPAVFKQDGYVQLHHSLFYCLLLLTASLVPSSFNNSH